MSGLSSQPIVNPSDDNYGPTSVIVDPLVELTQPGGPYEYGEAILTDGAGSYVIAPTLRPYFIEFGLLTSVARNGVVFCQVHGIDSNVVGFVIPLPTNLIAVSVALDQPIEADHGYLIEIFARTDTDVEVVATLSLAHGRRAWRRDLSVDLPEGTELGARIRHVRGTHDSVFSLGIIGVELEG